ncbi:MAG: DNA polymerase III subunit gamma/tau [Flavobacteriaceae bacterium]|nr:DNA polymerase III subunit gamma/tau [Flavobacteriaceae bacterium]
MEPFIISALKYRPQQFKDVVGQAAITDSLSSAILNNKLPQALLFCGPRGVGKTTCARILAKQINSTDHENIDPNQDFAFNIFELDAASNNSVDDIRNLNEQVRIPPQTGSHKVYIIDEVHMLSTAAFNAFLKTLEEPPKHVIFILATTEKHKIIPTILSRCQIFEFKRITAKDTQKYLIDLAKDQGVAYEDEALHLIAQKADGAMRDALSIFDRMSSFCNQNLTAAAVSENLNILDKGAYLEFTNHLIEHNIPESLMQFDSILQKGIEGHQFMSGLAIHFRDLLISKDPKTIPLLEISESLQQGYADQAKQLSLGYLLDAIDLAHGCELNFKNSNNKRLHVELCIMQLASLHFDGEKKKER